MNSFKKALISFLLFLFSNTKGLFTQRWGPQVDEVTCDGLPHLNGLPHLPGAPHLHVNRP